MRHEALLRQGAPTRAPLRPRSPGSQLSGIRPNACVGTAEVGHARQVDVDEAVERYGSAKRAGSHEPRTRPDGLDDAAVTALGKLSEALEVVEHARGMLYAFHRLTGRADATLQRAVALLREAGLDSQADVVEECVVGRNVLPGMWTFQLVEAYDDCYLSVFREVVDRVREEAGDPERHRYEAEMKEREQQPR